MAPSCGNVDVRHAVGQVEIAVRITKSMFFSPTENLWVERKICVSENQTQPICQEETQANFKF